MTEDRGWWRPFFEPLTGARAKCRECGTDLDIRGGRPQKHLALHGKTPEGTPFPEAPPPEEASPEEAATRIETGLEGLSRDERLRNLLFLANDSTAAQRDRVAAETLIAKYQGWLDSPPEENEDEARENILARSRRAVERKGAIPAEFEKVTRDREGKAWLLQNLVRSEDDREWALKVLTDLPLPR